MNGEMQDEQTSPTRSSKTLRGRVGLLAVGIAVVAVIVGAVTADATDHSSVRGHGDIRSVRTGAGAETAGPGTAAGRHPNRNRRIGPGGCRIRRDRGREPAARNDCLADLRRPQDRLDRRLGRSELRRGRRHGHAVRVHHCGQFSRDRVPHGLLRRRWCPPDLAIEPGRGPGAAGLPGDVRCEHGQLRHLDRVADDAGDVGLRSGRLPAQAGRFGQRAELHTAHRLGPEQHGRVPVHESQPHRAGLEHLRRVLLLRRQGTVRDGRPDLPGLQPGPGRLLRPAVRHG